MAQAQETGMFGPMPYEVEEQIRQQRRAEAMQMAQMNPNQVGRYLSASVGDRLGDGVAALTGKQDPRMAQAQELQAIQKRVTESGINPNDFEAFYSKLGEELAKAGKLKEAANVANVVQKWKENQQNLAIKEEQVALSKIRAQAYRDNKIKDMGPAAQEVFKKNNEYEPASLKAYLDSISKEKPDGDMSLLKPLVPAGYTSEYLTTDNKPVFTNKAGEVKVRDKDGNLVDYRGDVKGTKGTSVSVGLPSIETRIINEAPKPGMTPADTAALAKIAEGTKAMSSLEPALLEAEKIAKSENFVSGWASGFRTESKRAINTALKGLGFGVDDSQVDNTDMLKGYVSRAVLPLLTQIGGNDSIEEMNQMMKAIGNTEMSPAQFRRAMAITRKEVDRHRAKIEALGEGLDNGRTDVGVFDAIGRWPKGPVRQTAQGGTVNRTETKTTLKGQDAKDKMAEPAAPAPAQVPKAAEPPSSIVDKYMKLWGVSREETVRRLMEAKAKQGK